MLKGFLVSVLLSLIAIAPSSNAAANPSKTEVETLIFMRHGEKPILGLGQMTCKGLNRALKLTNVLKQKFGRPDYIFVPNPSYKIGDPGTYYYVRPLATLEPLAVQLNMPIKNPYSYSDVKGFSSDLLISRYRHSLIFIAWEHIKLVEVAKAIMSKLGGNPNDVPLWQEGDFDSLYVIKIVWNNGKGKATFSHQQEKLDNQKDNCPGMKADHSYQDHSRLDRTQTIVMVPTAESAGFGQLSCKGLNRAFALMRVLVNKHKYFDSNIDVFMAPSTDGTLISESGGIYSYMRGFMTIEPAAIYNGSPVYLPFGYKQTKEMTKYLMDDDYDDKAIVIAWERKELVDLAKAIYKNAGKDPNKIPSNPPDYDTIYKIAITRDDGKITSANFSTFAEKLNPGDVCPN